ncbi:putative 7-deoxyloganetin glucosyltransferase [Helianthus anomalus]
MSSIQEKKAHALCIPAPLQGHINPMLKLAKILHSKGLEALHWLPSFRFEIIPDGLPPLENTNATQDIPSLAKSVEETYLGPFKSLLTRVNTSYAPVTCIVSDLLMGFTLAAAEELGITINIQIFWKKS